MVMTNSHHQTTSDILHVAAAAFLIWYISGKTDQPRFKCAALLGISVGFVTYVELSSFLLSSAVVSTSSPSDTTNCNNNVTSLSADAPFALAALLILTVTSFLVGMASGSLLPRFSVGMCCGGVLALLGVALTEWMGLAHNLGRLYFPVLAGVLALMMGWISCRWVFNVSKKQLICSLKLRHAIQVRIALACCSVIGESELGASLIVFWNEKSDIYQVL